MAANVISTTVDEEEEEGPAINVLRRKLVYKVHCVKSVDFVQSTDQSTTSMKQVPQNTLADPSSLSFSKSPLEIATTSTPQITRQPMQPKVIHYMALSTLNYEQKNCVQVFLPPENAHEVSFYQRDQPPEQQNNSNYQFWQSITNQESKLSHVPISDVTSFDDRKIIAYSGSEQQSNAPFSLPESVKTGSSTSMLESKKKELHCDILRNENLSTLQHAALLGHTAGNLHNVPAYEFHSQDSNSINAFENNAKPIVMCWTTDNRVIVGGINFKEKTPISSLYETNVDKKANTTTISRISGDEQHPRLEYGNNEIIVSLTSQGDFINADLRERNTEKLRQHLVSVVVGLTMNGEIIRGSFTYQNMLGYDSGLYERSAEFNEHQKNSNYTANFTSKNANVSSELNSTNYSTPNSHITTNNMTANTTSTKVKQSYSNNRALIRRDSF